MLWDEKEGHVPIPGRCFGKKRVSHFPGQCLTAEPCSVLLAFPLEVLHFRETIASCLGWACRQVPGLKPCGAANPALPLCLETPVASADLVIAGSSHYSFLLLLESAILRFKLKLIAGKYRNKRHCECFHRWNCCFLAGLQHHKKLTGCWHDWNSQSWDRIPQHI